MAYSLKHPEYEIGSDGPLQQRKCPIKACVPRHQPNNKDPAEEPSATQVGDLASGAEDEPSTWLSFHLCPMAR